MLPVSRSKRVLLATYLMVRAVISAPSAPSQASPWACGWNLCRFIPGSPPAIPHDSAWDHWDKVTNFIVFGASYAETGPEAQILKPTPPYQTTANGPNYIDFLANGWNDSVITVDQYAIPGSPVDWSAFAGISPQSNQQNDFVHMVDSYVASFTKAKPTGWTPSNSIYHAEFGINDVNVGWKNYLDLNPKIFDAYQAGFEKLYEIGARNFLILNVPPIDRSPSATPTNTAGWKSDVADFNDKLKSMISTLGTKYTDATFFQYDMNGVFNAVLDNVAYSPITQGYKDTTHDALNCPAYQGKGNDSPDTSMDFSSPGCPYPVNEYLWYVTYHPTYPMHNLIAHEIAYGLEGL